MDSAPTYIAAILEQLPSTLLTVSFFNVLYNFWSLIFNYAGIPLAVNSVPQISYAFHWCRGEVDSVPTYLTAIFHPPLLNILSGNLKKILEIL